MAKKIIIKFLNGFCYSVSITMLIQALVMLISGTVPMLPEYALRFENPVSAYITELLLIGLMSAVTAAGTIVFELKKTGLLIQSLIYLVVMLSSWIPVACFVWGFHKYFISFVSTLCSFIVSYTVTWAVMYRLCRNDIDEINRMLKEGRQKNSTCNGDKTGTGVDN